MKDLKELSLMNNKLTGNIPEGIALTEPIDIYSEWIDECERVNTVDEDGVPVEDDDDD